MLLNYTTIIVGHKVVLVPYRPEHLKQYHEWMKDPALLEATGSEPLSLEEETEMQKSWRDDTDKCIFIVLAREKCSFDDGDFIANNRSAMVGDVNLFLTNEEVDEDQESSLYQQAEIDIMIAEQEFRGKGLGREACLLMMNFGAMKLNLRRFFSKISEENIASLALFEQKLGFIKCDYAACFKQFELERKETTPEQMIESLKDITGFDTLETIECPNRSGDDI